MTRKKNQIDEIKQVIVIRSDLQMGKGKIAAQASHASVLATVEAQKHNKNWYDRWMRDGMKKIAVKVTSEEDLILVFQKGSKEKIPRSLINDAGHTQLEPGTATAVALGPAPAAIIDPITKDLKLM